jgi:DNA-directed RNA polymerase subunit RPC12/RpoP
MNTKDTMLYEEGNKIAFKCECGANVFQPIDDDKTGYKCNRCGFIYYVEKINDVIRNN